MPLSVRDTIDGKIKVFDSETGGWTLWKLSEGGVRLRFVTEYNPMVHS